jgi:Glycosyl hydrolase family 63 C-terminal domain
VFDDNRYFDVYAEYAKGGPDDIAIRITVANRGPDAATLDLLPTLWFRNTWSWGRSGEGYSSRPELRRSGPATIQATHWTLGRYELEADIAGIPEAPKLLFTENETNVSRLYGAANPQPFVKDAFHRAIVEGEPGAVNPGGVGTKAAVHYRLQVPAGGERIVRLRLRFSGVGSPAFGAGFERLFAERIAEADEFYAERLPAGVTEDERLVLRQGYAGLLWSKQFYHYIVEHWLEGDPAQPMPPERRVEGRNAGWPHVFNRDVISMPDKWEYPWFAAWDLAFHMIPFARIDPHFAKEQLLLLLREWYMHPNGQIPAYEFAFGDVNPPVHAWACWRVYKMTGPKGQRDRLFLERAFHKLLLNFTWWVNRKDPDGKNLFAGGFLGLDNIGVFDRSQPLPTGGHLEQADGTAWMAFYCNTMLAMALELASEDPAYEDVASKFFEHFIAIADAINRLGGTGLWSEEDGFYYDQLHMDGSHTPLRIRSLVGVIPLIAVEVLEEKEFAHLAGFKKRMQWFLENREDLARQIACMKPRESVAGVRRLLAIPSRERLQRVLRYLLDETEFLSPYGIRSVSRVHREHPYQIEVQGVIHRVDYDPGESTTGLFGGNSNWRGPVWFPLNYLLLEALERFHHFYGPELKVECPLGSGRMLDLQEVARELASRLSRIFLADANGRRPSHGSDTRFATDPNWKHLVLFHEYFHGDTGRGVGASHQTGWTALVLRCIEDLSRARTAQAQAPENRPAAARRLVSSRS